MLRLQHAVLTLSVWAPVCGLERVGGCVLETFRVYQARGLIQGGMDTRGKSAKGELSPPCLAVFGHQFTSGVVTCIPYDEIIRKSVKYSFANEDL